MCLVGVRAVSELLASLGARGRAADRSDATSVSRHARNRQSCTSSAPNPHACCLLALPRGFGDRERTPIFLAKTSLRQNGATGDVGVDLEMPPDTCSGGFSRFSSSRCRYRHSPRRLPPAIGWSSVRFTRKMGFLPRRSCRTVRLFPSLSRPGRRLTIPRSSAPS